MELFIIQCQTCRARLKVKDASAIGEILACPKCASMVQVVPPVGWKAAPQALAAAAGPQMASASRSSAKLASASSASDIALKPSDQPAPVSPPALPQRTVAGTEPVAAPEAAAEAVPARRMRDWPMIGGALGGGIALGAAVWLSVYWLRAPAPRAVAQAPAPLSLQQADPAAQSTSAIAAAAPASVAQPESKTPPAAARNTSDADADIPAVELVDVPATPAVASAGSAAETVQPDAAPAAQAAIRLDPLKKNPQPAETIEQPSDPVSSGASTELPDIENSQPLDAKPSPPDADRPRRRALSLPEMDERLSTPVATVQFRKVPLAQFVEFIADLSGVPISIDDRALATAGKNRRLPVSVQLSDVTAAEALRAALKPLALRCELRDDDQQIVITAAHPSASQ